MCVAKGLKLKVRKFWGLTPTFAEVTGEKLVGKGVFENFPSYLESQRENFLIFDKLRKRQLITC